MPLEGQMYWMFFCQKVSGAGVWLRHEIWKYLQISDHRSIAFFCGNSHNTETGLRVFLQFQQIKQHNHCPVHSGHPLRTCLLHGRRHSNKQLISLYEQYHWQIRSQRNYSSKNFASLGIFVNLASFKESWNKYEKAYAFSLSIASFACSRLN